MISIVLLFTWLWFSFSHRKKLSHSLDQISLDIVIELFTKIIKTWDLRLWSQLIYFL
jgi:hypothetical protein